MLVCHICQCEVTGGWVYGFSPSPDSQKLALCPKHNTGNNQQIVAAAWQRLITNTIASTQNISSYHTGAIAFTVFVQFKNGGSLSYPCFSCVVTPHNTLRIHRKSGKFSYIPMADIKEYSIEPHDPTE